MNLVQESMTQCVLLLRDQLPDDEGGLVPSAWEEGDRFQAAVVCDQSLQARMAEKQGVTGLYTVTCVPGIVLEYHDVFRRLSDGKVFRVTSDGGDRKTPPRASFQFSQVTAEEWELPA